MPKTRDRFVKNEFTKILNPGIEENTMKRARFNHDKLDVKDIEGTNVDTYGRQKRIEGRNYMDMGDIDKTKPNRLKQNRVTNIPDYKLMSEDIDKSKFVKFKTKRDTDPLNPIYKVESQSRRQMI